LIFTIDDNTTSSHIHTSTLSYQSLQPRWSLLLTTTLHHHTFTHPHWVINLCSRVDLYYWWKHYIITHSYIHTWVINLCSRVDLYYWWKHYIITNSYIHTKLSISAATLIFTIDDNTTSSHIHTSTLSYQSLQPHWSLLLMTTLHHHTFIHPHWVINLCSRVDLCYWRQHNIITHSHIHTELSISVATLIFAIDDNTTSSHIHTSTLSYQSL